MKKTTAFLAALMLLLSTSHAQVAINTDGSQADGSAILDVKSTETGFLPPRMTTIQREAINSPAEGLIIFNNDSLSLEFWNGTAWFDIRTGNAYTPPPVVQGGCATLAYWMDRNLGASQVATSSTDALAYGDLYQWGRASDGHEIRTSGTTTTNATTAVPDLGNSWDALFIIEASYPYDWLTPADISLWQGVSGTNNPCPIGFRLPTETEQNCERFSWSPGNSAGAYASDLKWTIAGYRYHNTAGVAFEGTRGQYWSSTVSGYRSRSFYFDATYTKMDSYYRGNGFSVRCIKD